MSTEPAQQFDVMNGYLVEYSGGCTCAGGGEWPHEEHCGWEPIGPVEQIAQVNPAEIWQAGYRAAQNDAAPAATSITKNPYGPTCRVCDGTACGGGCEQDETRAASDWDVQS
jgi:hypothetical protein